MDKATLLVVDDTPDNLTLLSGLLRDEYRVKVANSGDRALKIAQAYAPPDLILLDIMMPEMDGYEVCRRLKANHRTRDIPVVFLTAKSEVDDETMGLALGAVDYITKPISPPIVLARIKTHLAMKRVADFLRDQNTFLENEVQRRSDQLVQATLARQRVESELNLALKLQRSMLPNTGYRVQGWQVASYLQPARTIGGDLYDYFLVGPDRLFFAAGDVSDKGVAAALFMVRVLTMLRWLAPTSTDPAQLMKDLNVALCRDNEACMFVTLGCGILDLKTRQVVYACGGHEPMVLFGAQTRLLDLEGGPALGLIDEAEFPLHAFRLGEDESLMLLSDGVAEANNPAQAEFGYDRLLSLIRPSVGGAQALVELALEAVAAFTEGAEAHDDLTIMVIA